MADNKNTIREQILTYLANHLRTMDAELPVGDPYGMAFSVVTRGPLNKDQKLKKKYAISIYEGSEQIVDSARRISNVQECALPITFEFYCLLSKNDNPDLDKSYDSPSVELNKILGVLQRRLREDHTLGCLAIDFYETDNYLDIDGPNDKSLSGSMTIVVRYRRHLDDPRKTKAGNFKQY